MTKTEREQWIKACEELLEFYRGKSDRFSGDKCPFCKVVRSLYNRCESCIWVLFTGRPCRNYLIEWCYKNDSYDSIKTWAKLKARPKWRALRRRQLKRWIERLKQEDMKGRNHAGDPL